VDGDVGVRRQHQLVRLDVAERRIAIQELPLLGDHLHLEGALVVGGERDRTWALSASGAVLEQLVRPEAGEEEHHRGSDHDPEELDLGVFPDRRSIEDRLVAPRVELHKPVAEEDREEAEHRGDERRHHLVVEDLSLSLRGRVARRDQRPDVDGHERRRDRAQDEPGGDDAEPVVRGVVRWRSCARLARHQAFTLRKPSM
jgi:hypothetical protein